MIDVDINHVEFPPPSIQIAVLFRFLLDATQSRIQGGSGIEANASSSSLSKQLRIKCLLKKNIFEKREIKIYLY